MRWFSHKSTQEDVLRDLWKLLKICLSELLKSCFRNCRSACAEDLTTIKRHIDQWYSWMTPFPKSDHSLAGFAPRLCLSAVLLTEILQMNNLTAIYSVNWLFERVLRNLKDGSIVTKLTDLPHVLWLNNEQDPEDLFTGFLKNPLLVKVVCTSI